MSGGIIHETVVGVIMLRLRKISSNRSIDPDQSVSRSFILPFHSIPSIVHSIPFVHSISMNQLRSIPLIHTNS